VPPDSADETESIATVPAALDAGPTLLDTGDFYGMGHNELLIREALRGRDRDQVPIIANYGVLRGPDGSWNGVGPNRRPPRTPWPRRCASSAPTHVDIY
jgi:aryl-alcohol dehydrogenase-like predicted oxidoreductase